MVKVPTKNSVAFGMVNALSIAKPARNGDGVESRFLEFELVGEFVAIGTGKGANMRRGVSTYPVLGSPVYAATQADLRFVFVRDGPQSARIGSIQQDPNLPAQVNVDDLLGKHYAIVGSTGSGKSCTVALILRTILTQNPNGHVLLLDPHNEYTRAFGPKAEVIGPSTLELPYWLFNFEELGEVLKHTGMVMGQAEAALLYDLITMAKRQFLGTGGDTRHITSDTPSPYRMTLVVQYLEEVMGRLDKPESMGPYQALKNALNMLMSDARFGFMFTGGITMRDNMVPILSRIFRVPVEGKPITILDLSAVASEITQRRRLRAVPHGLRLRGVERRRSAGPPGLRGSAPLCAGKRPPGFEPTKRALSRIAKEGRKYGLSLCVITPAPVGAAAGHAVPVQHDLRHAPDQRQGPADRAQCDGRSPRSRAPGGAAVAGQRRGHRGRRRRRHPDAPGLRSA